jgi:hypothetical protein
VSALTPIVVAESWTESLQHGRIVGFLPGVNQPVDGRNAPGSPPRSLGTLSVARVLFVSGTATMLLLSRRDSDDLPSASIRASLHATVMVDPTARQTRAAPALFKGSEVGTGGPLERNNRRKGHESKCEAATAHRARFTCLQADSVKRYRAPLGTDMNRDTPCAWHRMRRTVGD